MASQTTRQPVLAAQSPPKRFDLSAITGKGKGLPNRYLLYAVRGWGKTSLAAQTPKPIIIPTEDGIDTLIDACQVKETPHFPIPESWDALKGYADALLETDHDYRTLVIDVIDGCESLCHKFVCERDYGNDWSKRGFANFGNGYATSLPEWKSFLAKLDRLRTERKMTIFALCHTKIKTFKNPTDLDYDRYTPNIHDSTWCVTADWADVVLFGNYEVTVSGDTGAKKGKGSGGQSRMVYTQHHAAYDAKNRIGLPSEIEMGSSPTEAWSNFMSAVKAGRQSIHTEAVKQEVA
jgi:hypothetical protein